MSCIDGLERLRLVNSDRSVLLPTERELASVPADRASPRPPYGAGRAFGCRDNRNFAAVLETGAGSNLATTGNFRSRDRYVCSRAGHHGAPVARAGRVARVACAGRVARVACAGRVAPVARRLCRPRRPRRLCRPRRPCAGRRPQAVALAPSTPSRLRLSRREWSRLRPAPSPSRRPSQPPHRK